MGLFRPYQRDDAVKAEAAQTGAASEAPVVSASAPSGPAKKKVPTPTRREAEQARRDRLHPVLTKREAKARNQEARAASQQQHAREIEGQPGKELARDFIDSRRRLAQFTMPLILLCLVISFGSTYLNAGVGNVLSALTWVVIAAVVADLMMIWRKYRALHAERLPKESLKGLKWYVINRSINPRRLRTPAPRVKLGDDI